MFPIVLDILIDVFGNIITDILFAVFILVGLAAGILWRPGIGNRVIKLSPREHGFKEFDIETTYACSVECKDAKGYPPQRFFKHAPAFTGQTGKRLKKPSILYLGKEGTAYTWLEENDPVEIENLSDAVQTVLGQDFYEQIPEKQRDLIENFTNNVIVTFEEPKLQKLGRILKSLLGKTFYEEIPQEQRTLLEKSNINVTVDLKEGLTPPGFTPITEEDIYEEEDRKASQAYVESFEESARKDVINLMITLAAGVGGGFILAWFLGVGGTKVVESPTAQMILSALLRIF